MEVGFGPRRVKSGTIVQMQPGMLMVMAPGKFAYGAGERREKGLSKSGLAVIGNYNQEG